MTRVLDQTVISKLAGKAKSVSNPRPDWLHLDEEACIGILGDWSDPTVKQPPSPQVPPTLAGRPS